MIYASKLIHCDAYYIREDVFAPKTNLKTCCCFRRPRMRMTSLPIQLSWRRAQWGNIDPYFPEDPQLALSVAASFTRIEILRIHL